MPEPARTPGRAETGGGCLLVLATLGGLMLIVGIVHVAVLAAGDLVGVNGPALLLASLIGVAVLRAGRLRFRRRRAERELAGWLGTGGWEPAAGPWPWQALVRWPETVTVLRAYRKRVEGFPVRTGELTFDDNGLGATVDRRAGRAAFAVVALPRPAPSMAVRVHLRGPEQGDEFLRRFRPLGAAVGPEVRAAHLRGEIPPWTVLGAELFLFVPLERPLRPGDLEGAARRAVLVVRLLGLAAG